MAEVVVFGVVAADVILHVRRIPAPATKSMLRRWEVPSQHSDWRQPSRTLPR